jgi:hypothetical protein
MPYIYVNPYKTSYLAAKQELEQQKATLQSVTQRIAQLQETIRTLEPLAMEDGPAPTAGLPELCRQILMAEANCGFTAGVVMQHLASMGVDISGYASPLALLHTTLGRLVGPRYGIKKSVNSGGDPIYIFDPKLVKPTTPEEAKRKMVEYWKAHSGKK